MRKLFPPFLLFLLFSLTATLRAQSDECATATVLTNLDNYCSASGEFDNIGASMSGVVQPGCFPSVNNDVWFSFIAVATTLHVTVIGNTTGPAGPGGTLDNPQFAVYSGSCTGPMTVIACASDGFDNNIVETFAGPLTVGQTYYISVDGRNGDTGSFQLCVNNFNEVPDPAGDCATGVILCDKSSFNVESLIGTGNNSNEFDPGICIQTEFASAWYRWTCKDAGTLEFTITPTNPTDDIDFALFELPGGINDCSNKQKLRCEAAGENVGQPFSTWQICTGPTGLRSGETDTDEFPGCSGGNNNFVAPIDMVPGVSYALIINNFSNTGNGFSIEFGGTGTFQGPEAAFTAEPAATACQNETITFNDASQSVAGISAWEWNFGVGATPPTATGAGPHEVSYNSTGTKFITLSVTDESGCIVTTIQQYEILELPDVNADVVADYCGPNDATGAIYLYPSGTGLPYTYDWGPTGTFTTTDSLTDLAVGTYSVVVMAANGCSRLFTFDVPEGLSLAAGIDPVVAPTCNGDSDGSISISIQLSNPPVTFDFGNGPQPDNTLTDIPAGTYNVQVVDGQGCEGFFTIVVEDFPVLEVGIDPQDISCFGEADGTITAIANGGAGNYSYIWSNGQTTPTIENLTEGTYSVTVTDENGCSEIRSADIIEPDSISLSINVTDVLCAGDASGVISVAASGGTPPYEYSANGTDYQASPDLSGLPAGNHTVYVRDSRNCIYTIDGFIDEPLPLVVEAGPNQTIDLGFTANIHAVISPPFRPVSISWNPSETLDCNNCDNPTAMPVGTTSYLISILDSTGCTAVDSVTIFVNLERPVYIPNAFSPNNDGVNDFFTAYTGPAGRSIKKLRVFDRWGELVFDGTDLTPGNELQGWDGTFKGKPMNPAVFAWYAQIEFIDGVIILYEGDVMIVR
ncbi:MAG TPA: T9SS type B sorting domain-containing protein [Bacteroidetes bacterium]|nr:T9SS type B sorting domain-containing protein [Bacteroidota bacterium]